MEPRLLAKYYSLPDFNLVNKDYHYAYKTGST